MGKKRVLNRDRVVAAAAGLADELGDPAGVTLATLAKRLAIRPPSLYNHLSGIDDLRQALAIEALSRLLRALRQNTFGLTGWPAVRALCTAYRRFAHDHPGLYPFVVPAPQARDETLADLSDELVQFVQLTLAGCGVAGDEAIHAIRGLRALVHGFADLERAGAFALPADRETSFDLLVATYLAGLAAGQLTA